MKKQLSKRKRIIGIISTVLTAVIFAFALYTIVSVFIAKNNDTPVSLFGYSYHRIVTESMEPTLKVGTTVSVKSAKIDDAKKGDVIVYRCIDETSAVYGKFIIHRIYDIGTDDQGVYVLTEGDNPRSEPDPLPTRADNFIGIMTGGTFIAGLIGFFSNITNWFFLFAVMFLAWFCWFMFRRVIASYKVQRAKEIETEHLKAVAKEMGLDLEYEAEKARLLAAASEIKTGEGLEKPTDGSPRTDAPFSDEVKESVAEPLVPPSEKTE